MRATLFALPMVLALIACSDNHGTVRVDLDLPEPQAPVTGESIPLNEYGTPEIPPLIHEDELDEIAALKSHQVAILYTDDREEEDTGGEGYDEARIDFPIDETREFCVDDNGDPNHYLELYDSEGQLIATVENGSCESLELLAGLYSYRVYQGAHSGIIFVQGEAPAPPTVQVTSSSSPGRQVFGTAIETAADEGGVSAEDVLLRRLVNYQVPASTFRVSTRACVRCNLTGISLKSVNLDGVNLEKAHMTGAQLDEVSLKGARLVGTDLSGATLDSVNLSNADLTGTRLSSAIITATDMSDITVGDYIDDPWEFIAAPAISGTSTHVPILKCYGDWEQNNPFDPSQGGHWEEVWDCPGNHAYLFIVGLARDGWMYELSWDAKNSRGWRGYYGLPTIPKAQAPLSAPAASSDSTVGWHVVTYLGQDGALWHNWRSISKGWHAWSPLGRPDGVTLLSGPAASHGMLKADYRETEPPDNEFSNDTGPYHEVRSWESGPQAEFYIAAMGSDTKDQQHIWLRSWIKCDGKWDHSPANNSCKSYFEPGLTCVPAVAINDARWKGNEEWCDLGGPDVGAASAPTIVYLDEHDLVLSVVGTDGQLYQRGLGREARHSRSWQPVNMPPTAGGAGILAAPGGGNAGSVGDALLTILDENLSLWMGNSLSGGEYSWEQIAAPGQVEIDYAPDVESYGYSDRAYVVTVGREGGAELSGDLIGGNYFYKKSSNPDTLNENWHHPGKNPQPPVGTRLDQATLEDVTLGVPLNQVDVTGINVDQVTFTETEQLLGADLRDSQITNSSLRGLDLSTTLLQGADLSDSDLSGSNLAGVVLGATSGDSGCPEPKTETAYADDPARACLKNTDLTGTNLQGTDLSGIDLTNASFDELPDIEYLYVPFGGAIDASVCNDEDVYASVSGDDPGARRPDTINRTRLAGAQFTPAQFGPYTWRSLDLTGATVSALQGATLAARDYSDALMTGFALEASAGETVGFSQSLFKNAALAGLHLANPESDDPGLPEGQFDFSQSCLWSATLDGANLRRSNFTEANLRHVSAVRSTMYGLTLFDEALMQRADLRDSNFDGASFGKADLREVNASSGPVTFRGTNFSHANLFQADFSQAVFSIDESNVNAKLPYVFMKDTVLRNAEFIGAEMTNAYLYGAALDVSSADFSRADLSGAYLEGVDFSRGNAPGLAGAKLDNSVLINATLSGADLSPAQLANDAISASLVHARLEGALLDSAVMNEADLTDAVLCGPGQPQAESDDCVATPVSIERLDWNEVTESFESVTEDISPIRVSEVEGAQTSGAVCPDGTSGGQEGCGEEQWRYNELPAPREPVDPNAW